MNKLSKYRICPDCGSHNPPSRIECSECEADLTAVPVVDETSETANPAAEPKPLVRICSCGARNPAAMRKCSVCGEDISDVIPGEDIPEDALHFTLASCDGEYSYEIASSEVSIGREQEMQEYLSSKPYVSRLHAKLTLENDKLYITNLSSTNFTYVNNVRVCGRQELQDGDEIGLGGNSTAGSRQAGAAYFQVRICNLST